MKTITWIAISIISVMLLAVIWTHDPDQPDAGFLATDAYFLIGGEPVTLPFVAVNRITMPQGNTNPLPRFRSDARYFETKDYKSKFLELASNPTIPMQVAIIDVFYGVYGTYGEYSASGAICGLLTREWAKQICNNERAGILAHIPSSFSLVDRKSVPTFQNQIFSRDITTDQIARLKLDTGRPEVICGLEAKSCRGVVAITNELLVIWTVWDSRTQSETATEMGSRQGAALFQLVLNGFGNTEKIENILQD